MTKKTDKGEREPTATPEEIDPTIKMQATDRATYDRFAKFIERSGDVIQGKTLKEWMLPTLWSEISAWVHDFPTLAGVVPARIERSTEKANAAAVLQETNYSVRELTFAVDRVAVRHPEVRTQITPKVGKDPEENLKNLQRMRQLLDLHAAEYQAKGYDFRLDPWHSEAAVTQQASKHRQAEKVVGTLDDAGTTEMSTLKTARAPAHTLQSELNQFLLTTFRNDRAKAKEYGFEERTHARAKPAPATTTPPAPAPPPPQPTPPAPPAPTTAATTVPTTQPPGTTPPAPAPTTPGTQGP